MQKRNSIIVGLLLFILIGIVLAIPILIFQPEPGPLAFGVDNVDNTEHNVVVEIFDSDNQSIFYESYFLKSGDRTDLQYIKGPLGVYRFEVTLDQETKRIHMAEIRYARDVSGSDLVYIDIVNNTENPIEFGIAVP
ncbi:MULTISPECIES: hypothetical protein [Methanohalophilus]|jgi:hypothetical protein|uniref:Uncharacterized protein n=1 Tax=Methanohalophilus euhalobius TaxID=51203 RepID=A0A285F7V9_9EURY|nr:MULTISPECIES: hypothetical protein [Methanohalophilus]RSD35568.1 MAG: hypothetical protein CI953_6 [Methanohalophilus sp.]OBZ35394.1 MAG: hypothetical protein A9957_07585 [Methanohalophilus sp. DAL1]ODV50049.1 MAG: hypothetical protein A8273_708 [Methanohalophilus sp. 2-GBenrich]PQV43083.1 hypothetical protein B0H22_10393 [Methanohalophilus euhalobius]RNI09346.1 hypothetical protein EDD83_05175 [Methanohalophilus euhalobius]